MGKGYMGKILWVDLDKGTVAREVVDAAGNILGRQGVLDIVKEANREAQVGGMLDAILAGVDRFRGEGAAVDVWFRYF